MAARTATAPGEGDGSAEAPADAAREFRQLPLATLGARVLLHQWRCALQAEAGARSGENPEDLHQMRVAIRRFRAALGAFGAALDGAAGLPVVERWSGDAREVARALGRVRDLDVYIAYLQHEAEPARGGDLPALQRVIDLRQADRRTAQSALREILDGPVMARLRERVEAHLGSLTGHRAANQQPPGMPAGHRAGKQATVGRHAPRLLAKRLRRLRRLGNALVAPLPDDLHRVRIAAKRLRDAAEFLTPGFPETLPPIADLARQIQDALGEVHDRLGFDVALLADVERVAAAPDAAAAAGLARLARRNAGQREEALVRFRGPWSALPRPKRLRRQLRHVE